ncbi:MAG: hypothetical protein MI684_11030, partial [Chlorobiales bacterium]|nr:hypothetical protein [Chlorobiales bacterium]
KDGSMVEFLGNVRATREADEILARATKIFLYPENEKKSDNPDNVKKIVAAGEVEYTAGDRKAFADKAVYTTEDEVLVLTGKKARLLTGKSWITGKKITLFRRDGRAMVESDGKNRVEAFFNPEDKSAVQ